MDIKSLMTPHVYTIDSGATLQEAAEQMKKQDVGLLPVRDGSRSVGMISDRDIAVRAVAQGSNPQVRRVGDIMTHEVLTCREEDDSRTAAEIMRRHKVRRLLVENQDNHIVGILSLGDLALQEPDGAVSEEVLEDVSKPPKSQGQ